MASTKEYLLGGDASPKRRIIALMAAAGDLTLAEIAARLGLSIPTVTKLVAELVAEKTVADRGKVETAGGRRPNVFGLADEGVYFLGMDIQSDRTILTISDLRNTVIASKTISHPVDDTSGSLETTISAVEKFTRKSGVPREGTVAAGVCTAGRVNPAAGRSYGRFDDPKHPLRNVIEKRLGIPVVLDSDTRAQCYAERALTDASAAKDMIYINLGRGMAAGIVVGGSLYRGRSGFAGELAVDTPPLTDETVDAALRDDTPSMDLIEEAAAKAGRAIATLLGIFNPELVVVGGGLARAGDYLMLPLRAAANRHTPNAIYADARFRLAKTGPEAAALGMAIMARDRVLAEGNLPEPAGDGDAQNRK